MVALPLAAGALAWAGLLLSPAAGAVLMSLSTRIVALSFPWLMAGIIVESILYAWVYNSTRGSLLLVTIIHAAANTASVFLPTANTVSGENLNVRIMAVAIEFSVESL